MGEIRKIKNQIRLTCDCGIWVHQISVVNDKLEVESYKLKSDEPKKKEKKESSIFDFFGEEEEEEEEEEDE